LLFQLCKGLGHGPPMYRAYHIRSVFAPKKENSHITTFMSRTRSEQRDSTSGRSGVP
jgi:hypothetical protein